MSMWMNKVNYFISTESYKPELYRVIRNKKMSKSERKESFVISFMISLVFTMIIVAFVHDNIQSLLADIVATVISQTIFTTLAFFSTYAFKFSAIDAPDRFHTVETISFKDPKVLMNILNELKKKPKQVKYSYSHAAYSTRFWIVGKDSIKMIEDTLSNEHEVVELTAKKMKENSALSINKNLNKCKNQNNVIVKAPIDQNSVAGLSEFLSENTVESITKIGKNYSVLSNEDQAGLDEILRLVFEGHGYFKKLKNPSEEAVDAFNELIENLEKVVDGIDERLTEKLIDEENKLNEEAVHSLMKNNLYIKDKYKV